MKKCILWFSILFIHQLGLCQDEEVQILKDQVYLSIDSEVKLINCLNKFHWYQNIKTSLPSLAHLEKYFNNDHLKYDLYLPENDSVKYPLIIFMHGGGLLKGDKSQRSMQFLGSEMAKKGIPFASIEYRIQALSLLSFTDAGYLAMQDLYAAIGYFKENSAKWNIDSDYIYVGGISAGAVTAMQATFYDREQIGAIQHARLDEQFGCLKCLYPVNTDYETRGVINISGAVTDLNIMSDERHRIIQFVGLEDRIIDAEEGFPFSSVFQKPNDEASFVESLLSVLRSDGRESLHADLIDVMELPYMYGALKIDEYASVREELDVRTVVFENYDHRLISSRKGKRPMGPSVTIINGIEEWIKEDLKCETPEIIYPEKIFYNFHTQLKCDISAAEFLWYVDDIKVGAERYLSYKFQKAGHYRVGLKIKNDYGIWSQESVIYVEIVKPGILDHVSYLWSRLIGNE